MADSETSLQRSMKIHGTLQLEPAAVEARLKKIEAKLDGKEGKGVLAWILDVRVTVTVNERLAPAKARELDVVALDDALNELALMNPQHGRVARSAALQLAAQMAPFPIQILILLRNSSVAQELAAG